jgi:hypothetical protein
MLVQAITGSALPSRFPLIAISARLQSEELFGGHVVQFCQEFIGDLGPPIGKAVEGVLHGVLSQLLLVRVNTCPKREDAIPSAKSEAAISGDLVVRTDQRLMNTSFSFC